MDNYCFFRLLDDGLPSYFSLSIQRKTVTILRDTTLGTRGYKTR